MGNSNFKLSLLQVKERIRRLIFMLLLRAHWAHFITIRDARLPKTHLCFFFCAATFALQSAHWLI